MTKKAGKKLVKITIEEITPSRKEGR